MKTVSKNRFLGKRSLEKISHFNCVFCKKWWSVGDAPKTKCKWFCTWCGKEQEVKEIKN